MRLIAAIAALAFAPAGPGIAAPATGPAGPPPIEAYGHLPNVDLITVSPDGSKFAFAVGDEARRQVQIRGVADQKPLQTLGTGQAKIRALHWAGETHVLITTSQTATLGGITGPKREYMLVVDFNLATGRQSTLLSRSVDNLDKLNSVVAPPTAMVLDGRPVAFLEGLTFPASRGVVTLFRVDLDTGKTRLVMTGNDATRSFLVDPTGTVAAAQDIDHVSGRSTIWTRGPGGAQKWVTNAKANETLDLAGFGRTPGTVLVATDDDEHARFHEVPIGSETMGPPIEPMTDGDPVADPHSGTAIGVRRDVGPAVGYSFFDAADQKLWNRIVRAFPGAVVRLESWSDDRRTIVLRVEGKATGPAWFLLDAATLHARWLANEYADILGDDLAEVRAIDYAAADGQKIPAFLTLPPGRSTKDPAATGLPLVVLAHGGPAARDEAGFDWWSQALASRGYAVLQPQFRGSTGFGEKLHAAGYGEWGRKMQTDLSDGVAYLAKAGTIDPARVAIVGGSYGGYAALAGVTLQTGIYRCAVSLAGPSDLRAMLAYEETLSGGAKTASMRFWQRFMGAKSPADPVLDALSPVRRAANATVPVLLIHGVDDTVVPFAQSTAMMTAMKKAGHPAQLVTLKGEDHWLSRSETRSAMLTATAAFLAEHLPVAATK